jgi:gluconate 2-dehydrogenase gamma chain
MDRRDALRFLSLSPATSLFFTSTEAEAFEELKEAVPVIPQAEPEKGRTPEELQRDEQLLKQSFFTAHEMATLNLLTDILIPADDTSVSASQAKVPQFIEFMAKDNPSFQVPLRGGLAWIDNQMRKTYGKPFKECSQSEQIALIDQIAYPQQVKPEMKAGAAFFSLLRNLTASGYFSTEAGWKYLGYQGNTPNNWTGVPQEVKQRYGL